MDQETVLWNQGIITLFGEVDTIMAQHTTEFILAQNFRSSKQKLTHLTLVVNSEGGSLSDAFAMIDVIRSSNIPVHTLGLGQISSAGLMIFMSGYRGYRTITSNTSILSHEWTGDVTVRMNELVSMQQDFQLTTDRMMAHYQRCTQLAEEEIRAHLLPPHDVYLTARQAVELGIADKIQDACPLT